VHEGRKEGRKGEGLNSSKRHIICYGGANLASIEKYIYVKKVYQGVCPHRGSRVVIFSF
jgi:hypothetical protein